MKTLMVLRHAKSDWSGQVEDFDRPLNARGQRDAPRVGQLLSERNLWPQWISCSSSKRTRQTLKAMLEHAGDAGPKIVYDDALYLATCRELLKFVQDVPESAARAMMIAHNPGVMELVSVLCGRSIAMPTAALAVIELSIDSWEQLCRGVESKLSLYWTPKQGDGSENGEGA